MSVYAIAKIAPRDPFLVVPPKAGEHRWKAPALLAVAALAAVLAFYPEIALPTRILADYDVWTYFYPLRTYAARAIQAGRFPLWNPDTFLGAPFFANPQTSLLYPGSILFYVLPVPYAYSLSVIGHVLVCWVLTFAFLRRIFGVGTMAGFVGTSTFALGGFVSSQVGHINQLSATALMPGVALAAVMAVRQPSLRWALGGALLFAAQLLAGHAQESYMTLWVVGVLLIWELTSAVEHERSAGLAPSVLGQWRPRPELRAAARVIGVAGLIAGLGFALAAVQLLPTAELSAASIRGGGMTFDEATSFSLPPNLLARSLLPGYWFNVFGEYIGYVGGVGLGFAMLGFLYGRRRAVWAALALVIIGLVLALGNANPLAPALYRVVPGLGLFRVPARWLLVYSFGAASLAALGVDWARVGAAGRGARMARWADRLRAEAGSQWRPIMLAVWLLILAATALWPAPAVSGRIYLFWLLGLGAAFGLAWLSHGWRSPVVSAIVALAVLVDLRFAALDLPQRHAVPSEVADQNRGVPTSLRAMADASRPRDRLLSVARTEYELDDIATIDARFPDLSPTARFWFTSAMKLDEVMSPNVPLTYGLSTADGYDGGVLPLRHYLDIASLLIPREEIRADGVLRTRLIALPEARYLDLLGVSAVIAGRSVDLELDGVRYDVATARSLAAGERITMTLPEPSRITGLGILASVADGAETSTGDLVLTRVDGRSEQRSLRVGREIYTELEPGPVSAEQPTAGPSRAPRRDTAVRLVVPSGAPVASLDLTWAGPGRLALRAITALDEDGSQRALLLQEGLTVVDFPTQKLFRRTVQPWSTLMREAQVRDDPSALDWMRAASADELKSTVMLAPRDRVEPEQASSAEDNPGTFRLIPSAPERIVYVRESEGAPGYLLVPDAWFPGWRAQIDGQPAEVQRADVLFKAVWVPTWARQVELNYEPASVRAGALISVAALLLWLGLMVGECLGWRRPRAGLVRHGA